MDYCQFGEAWRKRTRLRVFGFDLPGQHLCRQAKGCCSATGKPHVAFTGTKNGRFMTDFASPYPVAFCEWLARASKAFADAATDARRQAACGSP